jgi:hypothetical protein
MSSDDDKDRGEKERVRTLIRQSFPRVCEHRDRPLAHDEAVELRRDLITLGNEDLPFFLGQVLEDLLDTHTGDLIDPEGTRDVVEFLDVLMEHSITEGYAKSYGSQSPETLEMADFENYVNPMLRTWKTESFALFTPEQANAILKWLELARGWKDLELWLADVNSAISYWRRRAENVVGED